jgi:hypothetical protein
MDPTQGGSVSQHHALVAPASETVAADLERATAVEELRRHVSWLDASAKVSQQLLRSSSRVTTTVQEIGAHLLALTDARSLTIAIISPDNPQLLEVRVAAGVGASRLLGRTYPKTTSLAGAVIDRDRSELNPAHELYAHDMPTGPGKGACAVMGVPIHGVDGRPRGAMVLHRRAEQHPFDPTDLNMAEDFARQTSLALELAENRAVREKLEQQERYDRSARTMTDNLIQDLFSIGITIQSAEANLRSGDPATAAGRAAPYLTRAVDDLDEAIRRLRRALESPTSVD